MPEYRIIAGEKGFYVLYGGIDAPGQRGTEVLIGITATEHEAREKATAHRLNREVARWSSTC